MKSNLIKSALVAIVGLALGASALNAQTTTATSTMSTTATTTAKVKKIEYKGTVKAVDTAANSITITNKKGDLTLMVNTSTKIAVAKQPATLSDITVGEKVSGSYTKDAAGTMTAASIHGHPAKAATTSTTTSATTTTTPATP
jgi:hypothetical protein